MEFWTILWITVLGGPLDGTITGLIYPDLASCEAALNPVSDTLPYDHKLLCEESTNVSSTVRPRQRPEGLGGG